MALFAMAYRIMNCNNENNCNRLLPCKALEKGAVYQRASHFHYSRSIQALDGSFVLLHHFPLFFSQACLPPFLGPLTGHG